MRITRSWREVVIGIIILIIALFFILSEFDIKMSKQLEGVDITWEEMHGKVK